MLEQTNIYDLLGESVDPVYKKLSNLKKGESLIHKNINISLNEFDLYEVSNEYCHEGFGDVMKCYRFVCQV